MNAKRARHYRRVARARTVGYVNRAYARSIKGTVTLVPNCTRAEYRVLKSEYRSLHREGVL